MNVMEYFLLLMLEMNVRTRQVFGETSHEGAFYPYAAQAAPAVKHYTATPPTHVFLRNG